MNDQTFESITFTKDQFEKDFVSRSECINCTFTSLDLTGYDFSQTKFIECLFFDCNLSNAKFVKGILRSCEFSSSKLIGIDWSKAFSLVFPKFTNCAMDYSIFNSMTLKKTVFSHCSLKEADFYGANLSESDFRGSLLKEANFSRANLTECDFRGAKEYSLEPTYTIVSKARFSLPEALALLRSFDVKIE